MRASFLWPILVGILGGLLFAAPLRAQEDEEEEPEFLPGLVLRAVASDGTALLRATNSIAMVPGASDGRAIPARWTGYLVSQNEGQYRLHAYVAGRLTVRLAGREVLDVEQARAGWISGAPIDLPFDWHPFELEYHPAARDAALSLYWSGPGFHLEPLGPRQLYHDPAETPPDDVARGAALARALRCDACHGNGTRPRNDLLAAPALDQLGSNVYREWLRTWLGATPPTATEASASTPHAQIVRRMPHFALSDEQRKLLIDYLAPADPPQSDGEGDSPDHAELLVEGRELLLTRGCLACHRWNALGTGGAFSGGDLSDIATKRPKSFFARWLAEPQRLNADHRMPVFEFTAREQQALAAFLATCGTAERSTAAIPPDPERRAEAQRLLDEYRCAACHQLPRESDMEASDSNLSPARKLDATSNWDRACSARSSGNTAQPAYGLDPADQAALRAFYSQHAAVPLDAPQRLALRLRELNCTGCHARYEQEGLTSRLPDLAEAHPELASTLSTLAPPSLNSVGDKLHDEALHTAVARTAPPRRPWLAVRMPRYPLTDAERSALVSELIAIDRIPDHAPTSYESRSVDAPRHVADRLVTADGFGCTSCHAVGQVKPQTAVLNTLGPDLLMVERHIRRPWFDRWVRNPARIVPRMEMPSVTTPVPGVLDNDLERQLGAVWNALNQPDFRPPAPNPVRIVRTSGLGRDRARFITDVTKVGDHTYVKPIVIGLPNRHNVLFDFETARLAHWWLGDTARERTLGKTWFWETGADDLVQFQEEVPELALRSSGEAIAPQSTGQFLTEFDELRHLPDGLEVRYRLQFGALATLTIEQRFEGLTGHDEFVRTIKLANVPRECSVEFAVGVPDGQFSITSQGQQLHFARNIASCAIVRPTGARLDPSGHVVLTPDDSGTVELELVYRSTIPAGTLAPVETSLDLRAPEKLDIIPGLSATRLPLPTDVMPTGLAWDERGQLILSSLKGQVLRATDENGDGWQETLQSLSEDLAAPYGLATGPRFIDVINKYALLRLVDENGDGFCERTITLASGWGHTADYHDWAVGLPRDGAGGYYIGLPCQQDERSEPAARYRGTVVRLAPRAPSADDPRLFTIETLSTGHRFPMGLARNQAGDLFVTDNQGNFNPFNELNHVIAGADYGFRNAIERKQPPLSRPLTPPAIDIPHPWTRSVNGICFLTSTDAAHGWGAFEGHLVGCEYDTRRLIRMSLEKVGDTYQGAAYPLTLYQVEGPTLLGPLVSAIGPKGDLYVGCIRDSGWGGANNIGGVVRIEPPKEALPAGIAEVRLQPRGFAITFTRRVRRDLATDLAYYHVTSYRRIATADYGGPDVDRRTERPTRATLAADEQTVILEFSELREGFVYEFHLRNLAGENELFFPAEAHYTLRRRLP